MDTPAGSASLQRSSSQHSYNSTNSIRSQTVRIRPRKYASYMSSSTSSINTSTSTSDKSLTSFPSFSPESKPNQPRANNTDGINATSIPKNPDITPIIADEAVVASPASKARSALFDDAPISIKRVPGAIHNLTTQQIENLIARNGAVSLIRQIAEDLAERDTQIANIRRKSEEKERAMRKIILQCGLSNLDLEIRLRAIEGEQKAVIEANSNKESTTGLEDLMSDAMRSPVTLNKYSVNNDATIRAVDKLRALDEKPRTMSRGWRGFLWGGTSRKPSRASSVNDDYCACVDSKPSRTGPTNSGRKTVLQEGLFQAPEAVVDKANALNQQHEAEDKTNNERISPMGITALALKFVTGAAPSGRTSETDPPRGRSNSFEISLKSDRESSVASIQTTTSVRTISLRSALVKVPPESIVGLRRPVKSTTLSHNKVSRASHDRCSTTGLSNSQVNSSGTKQGSDNSGPVEMDTILPLEEQPPTLTRVNNFHNNQEFLTDRFGFIYDQRRKNRKKGAGIMQISERVNRIETLSSTRSTFSAKSHDETTAEENDAKSSGSLSIEGTGDEQMPTKRWQDYLKIATFPTELLSHTPSVEAPALQILEGIEVPKSPTIVTEGRGFAPLASTTASQPAMTVTSDHAIISKSIKPTPSSPEPSTEDTEPVKLLLKQLGDVHDSLQREKTIKWNDFLRKVRAERKREGEAAATADSRSPKILVTMPEATLTDGEMIGVAGLGNKGKVGRAKWNEFKVLVLGGIPVTYRAKIWSECSGAAALRIPGYYESLISRPITDDDPAILAQIQMDINRTLTDNIYFRKGTGVNKLNEVLLAYSRRNADVGYCQGMNLITACLLLIMPTAEDAFWLLVSIIETILPKGYHDHSLLASRADQQVLRQYVAEVLPKLSSHLDNLSIELEALTFPWFLSVFTDCLSAEALFRVWDVVFCTNDGSTFLFQVALALLKLNETPLLQCRTAASLYTYINHQMTNHAISIDGLIQASEGLRKTVRREVVEARRLDAIDSETHRLRHGRDYHPAHSTPRAAKSGAVTSGATIER
ncbi:unnamed protein product [Blumeria hordei]|uniref:Rab-GAP TBC domain-containing protein n=1 Tax=Blumeria hordei TaxID=2867405 RepID=A0A383UZD4_BLUHO|nr:unnamed protein product [Blumeria hordei]